MSWISGFIRGKLKFEIDPKTLPDQFIDQKGKNQILRFFELFLALTSNLLYRTYFLYQDLDAEDVEKLKLDEIIINFAIPKYKNGLTILYKIPDFSKAIAELKNILSFEK